MIIADSQDFAGCAADDRNRPAPEVNDVLKMTKPDPSSRRTGLRITWSSLSYLPDPSRRYVRRTTRRDGTSYPSGSSPHYQRCTRKRR
jgi:hypothetical protein